MINLRTHFPFLTDKQFEQLTALEQLYREWNARINVISRKDIGQIRVHHILHSLAIAKVIRFKPGTAVMDAGSGGGFPGIPLAVMFPDVQFTLVDSIGKKSLVISEIATAMGLQNIVVRNARFETIRGPFDFVTGRAVSRLPVFYSMVRRSVTLNGFNDLPNGVLYLAGGDLTDDIRETGAMSAVWNLSEFFADEYFSTKKIVHLHETS